MGPALLNIDYPYKRVINSRRICVYTLKNYLEKTANLSVLYCHTILSYYPNQKITQTLQGTKTHLWQDGLLYSMKEEMCYLVIMPDF